MSGHSPAPWRREPTVYVDGHGGRTPTGCYVLSADDDVVCRIEGVDATSEADAALIEAAPRLLDALETTRGNLVSLLAAHPGSQVYGPWLAVVEGALAAAVEPGTLRRLRERDK